MKRNLSNLTKEEIKCIKEWIEDGDMENCPFYPLNTDCYLGGQRCKDLFPSILSFHGPSELGEYECPCTRLSASYVLKTIKQILKEKKNERENLHKETSYGFCKCTSPE